MEELFHHNKVGIMAPFALAAFLVCWQRSFCFGFVPFGYFPLPKFYEFESEDAKERVLYNNFNRIDREVKEMIKEIQTEFKV